MSAVLSAEILRARRRGVTSSEHTTKHGAMAQLVAHHTGSVGVRGSSPLSSTSTSPRGRHSNLDLSVLDRPPRCSPSVLMFKLIVVAS